MNKMTKKLLSLLLALSMLLSMVPAAALATGEVDPPPAGIEQNEPGDETGTGEDEDIPAPNPDDGGGEDDDGENTPAPNPDDGTGEDDDGENTPAPNPDDGTGEGDENTPAPNGEGDETPPPAGEGETEPEPDEDEPEETIDGPIEPMNTISSVTLNSFDLDGEVSYDLTVTYGTAVGSTEAIGVVIVPDVKINGSSMRDQIATGSIGGYLNPDNESSSITALNGAATGFPYLYWMQKGAAGLVDGKTLYSTDSVNRLTQVSGTYDLTLDGIEAALAAAEFIYPNAVKINYGAGPEDYDPAKGIPYVAIAYSQAGTVYAVSAPVFLGAAPVTPPTLTPQVSYDNSGTLTTVGFNTGTQGHGILFTGGYDAGMFKVVLNSTDSFANTRSIAFPKALTIQVEDADITLVSVVSNNASIGTTNQTVNPTDAHASPAASSAVQNLNYAANTTVAAGGSFALYLAKISGSWSGTATMSGTITINYTYGAANTPGSLTIPVLFTRNSFPSLSATGATFSSVPGDAGTASGTIVAQSSNSGTYNLYFDGDTNAGHPASSTNGLFDIDAIGDITSSDSGWTPHQTSPLVDTETYSIKVTPNLTNAAYGDPSNPTPGIYTDTVTLVTTTANTGAGGTGNRVTATVTITYTITAAGPTPYNGTVTVYLGSGTSNPATDNLSSKISLSGTPTGTSNWSSGVMTYTGLTGSHTVTLDGVNVGTLSDGNNVDVHLYTATAANDSTTGAGVSPPSISTAATHSSNYYVPGKSLTLVAGTGTGKALDKWNDGSTDLAGSTATMPSANATYTAFYKNTGYTVTVNVLKDGSAYGSYGGTITLEDSGGGNPRNGSHDGNGVFTFSNVPDGTYQMMLSGSAITTDGSTVQTISVSGGAATADVHYNTVSYSSTNGSITLGGNATNNTTVYLQGTTLSNLAAVPNTNYSFDTVTGWKANGVATGFSAATSSSTNYILPASSAVGGVLITAPFTKTHFDVTITTEFVGASTTIRAPVGGSVILKPTLSGSDITLSDSVTAGVWKNTAPIPNGTYDIYIGSNPVGSLGGASQITGDTTMTLSFYELSLAMSGQPDTSTVKMTKSVFEGGGDTAAGATASAFYLSGETAAITTTPAGTASFTEWQNASAGQISTSQTYNYTTGAAAATLTAVYATATYTGEVEMHLDGNATPATGYTTTVTLVPAGSSYGGGDDISLAEVSSSGTWETSPNALSAGVTSYAVYVDGQNTGQTVTYAAQTATVMRYTVEIQATGGASPAYTVDKPDGGTAVKWAFLPNTAVTLTVSTGAGWRADAWTVTTGTGGTGATANLTAAAGNTTATYNVGTGGNSGAVILHTFKQQYTVVLAAALPTGVTSVTADSQTLDTVTPQYFDVNTNINLVAALAATHEFSTWSANNGGAVSVTNPTANDGSAYFTLTADTAVSLTVLEKPTLTLNHTTWDIGPGASTNSDPTEFAYDPKDGTLASFLLSYTKSGGGGTGTLTIDSTAATTAFATSPAFGTAGTYTLSKDWMLTQLGTTVADYDVTITVTAVDSNTLLNVTAASSMTVKMTQTTLTDVDIELAAASGTSYTGLSTTANVLDSARDAVQYKTHAPSGIPTTDLTWTWYTSTTSRTGSTTPDTASGSAAVLKANGPHATHSKLTTAELTTAKGLYVFAVVTASGSATGSYMTDSFAVDFDAAITLQKDGGNVDTANASYTVELRSTTTSHNVTAAWDSVGGTQTYIAAGLHANETYEIYVNRVEGDATLVDSGTTDITSADRAETVYYYSVSWVTDFAQVHAQDNTLLDVGETIAAGTGVASATAGSINISTSGLGVLSGSAITAVADSLSAYDYTLTWSGTGVNASTGAIASLGAATTIGGTLSQNTYTVTGKVSGTTGQISAATLTSGGHTFNATSIGTGQDGATVSFTVPKSVATGAVGDGGYTVSATPFDSLSSVTGYQFSSDQTAALAPGDGPIVVSKNTALASGDFVIEVEGSTFKLTLTNVGATGSPASVINDVVAKTVAQAETMTWWDTDPATGSGTITLENEGNRTLKITPTITYTSPATGTNMSVTTLTSGTSFDLAKDETKDFTVGPTTLATAAQLPVGTYLVTVSFDTEDKLDNTISLADLTYTYTFTVEKDTVDSVALNGAPSTTTATSPLTVSQTMTTGGTDITDPTDVTKGDNVNYTWYRAANMSDVTFTAAAGVTAGATVVQAAGNDLTYTVTEADKGYFLFVVAEGKNNVENFAMSAGVAVKYDAWITLQNASGTNLQDGSYTVTLNTQADGNGASIPTTWEANGGTNGYYKTSGNALTPGQQYWIYSDQVTGGTNKGDTTVSIPAAPTMDGTDHVAKTTVTYYLLDFNPAIEVDNYYPGMTVETGMLPHTGYTGTTVTATADTVTLTDTTTPAYVLPTTDVVFKAATADWETTSTTADYTLFWVRNSAVIAPTSGQNYSAASTTGSNAVKFDGTSALPVSAELRLEMQDVTAYVKGATSGSVTEITMESPAGNIFTTAADSTGKFNATGGVVASVAQGSNVTLKVPKGYTYTLGATPATSYGFEANTGFQVPDGSPGGTYTDDDIYVDGTDDTFAIYLEDATYELEVTDDNSASGAVEKGNEVDTATSAVTLEYGYSNAVTYKYDAVLKNTGNTVLNIAYTAPTISNSEITIEQTSGSTPIPATFILNPTETMEFTVTVAQGLDVAKSGTFALLFTASHADLNDDLELTYEFDLDIEPVTLDFVSIQKSGSDLAIDKFSTAQNNLGDVANKESTPVNAGYTPGNVNQTNPAAPLNATNLTYQWYRADVGAPVSVDAGGNVTGGNATAATGAGHSTDTYTPNDDDKGMALYLVLGGQINATGYVLSDPINVNYDATIQINIDGDQLGNGYAGSKSDADFKVVLYKTGEGAVDGGSGGGGTPIATKWDGTNNVFTTENAPLAVDQGYDIYVTILGGTTTTLQKLATTVVVNSTTDTRDIAVDYYTVGIDDVSVHADSLEGAIVGGTFADVLDKSTQTYAITAKLDGGGLDGTGVDDGDVVLTGSTVAFASTAWDTAAATYDYALTWVTATATALGATTATLTYSAERVDVAATLMRNLYDVKITLVSGANGSLADAVFEHEDAGGVTETFTSQSLSALAAGGNATVKLPRSVGTGYDVAAYGTTGNSVEKISGNNGSSYVEDYKLSDYEVSSSKYNNGADSIAVQTATELAAFVWHHDDGQGADSGDKADVKWLTASSDTIHTQAYGASATPGTWKVMIRNTGNVDLPFDTTAFTVTAGSAAPTTASDVFTSTHTSVVVYKSGGTTADNQGIIPVGGWAVFTLTATNEDSGGDPRPAGTYQMTYMPNFVLGSVTKGGALNPNTPFTATMTITKAEITEVYVNSPTTSGETGALITAPVAGNPLQNGDATVLKTNPALGTGDDPLKDKTPAIAWTTAAGVSVPGGTNAAPGTVYIATVVLTADANHEFATVATGTYSLNDILSGTPAADGTTVTATRSTTTVTNDTLTLKITFPPTAPTLTSVTLTGTDYNKLEATSAVTAATGVTTTVYYALVENTIANAAAMSGADPADLAAAIIAQSASDIETAVSNAIAAADIQVDFSSSGTNRKVTFSTGLDSDTEYLVYAVAVSTATGSPTPTSPASNLASDTDSTWVKLTVDIFNLPADAVDAGNTVTVSSPINATVGDKGTPSGAVTLGVQQTTGTTPYMALNPVNVTTWSKYAWYLVKDGGSVTGAENTDWVNVSSSISPAGSNQLSAADLKTAATALNGSDHSGDGMTLYAIFKPEAPPPPPPIKIVTTYGAKHNGGAGAGDLPALLGLAADGTITPFGLTPVTGLVTAGYTYKFELLTAAQGGSANAPGWVDGSTGMSSGVGTIQARPYDVTDPDKDGTGGTDNYVEFTLRATEDTTGATVDIEVHVYVQPYQLVINAKPTATPDAGTNVEGATIVTDDLNLTGGAVEAPYYNGSGNWVTIDLAQASQGDTANTAGEFTIASGQTYDAGTHDYDLEFAHDAASFEDADNDPIYLDPVGETIELDADAKTWELTTVVTTALGKTEGVYLEYYTGTTLDVSITSAEVTITNTGNQTIYLNTPTLVGDTNEFELVDGSGNPIAWSEKALAAGASSTEVVYVRPKVALPVGDYSVTVTANAVQTPSGAAVTDTVLTTVDSIAFEVTPKKLSAAVIAELGVPAKDDPMMNAADLIAKANWPTNGNVPPVDTLNAQPYAITNVEWQAGGSAVTGNFKAGVQYTVEVTLTAHGNYTFFATDASHGADDGHVDPNDSGFTLNGYKMNGNSPEYVAAITTPGTAGNTITLTYVFDALPPDDLTVTAEAKNPTAVNDVSTVASTGEAVIELTTGANVDIYYYVTTTNHDTDLDDVAEFFTLYNTPGTGHLAHDVKTNQTPVSDEVTVTLDTDLSGMLDGTKYYVYAVAAPENTTYSLATADLFSNVAVDDLHMWYSVKVLADGGGATKGTINTPTPDANNVADRFVKPGGNMAIKVTPKTGWPFKEWKIIGADGSNAQVDPNDSTSTTSTFTAPDDQNISTQIEVKATFDSEVVLQLLGNQRNNEVPQGYSNHTNLYDTGATNVARVKNIGGTDMTNDVAVIIVAAANFDPEMVTDVSSIIAHDLMTATIPQFAAPNYGGTGSTDTTGTTKALAVNEELTFDVLLKNPPALTAQTDPYQYYIIAYDSVDTTTFAYVKLDITIVERPTILPKNWYYDLNTHGTVYKNVPWGGSANLLTVDYGNAPDAYDEMLTMTYDDSTGTEQTLAKNGTAGQNTPYNYTDDSTNDILTVTMPYTTIQTVASGYEKGQSVPITLNLDNGTSTPLNPERTMTLHIIDTRPEIIRADIDSPGGTGMNATLTAKVFAQPKNPNDGTDQGAEYEIPNAGITTYVDFYWYKVVGDMDNDPGSEDEDGGADPDKLDELVQGPTGSGAATQANSADFIITADGSYYVVAVARDHDDVENDAIGHTECFVGSAPSVPTNQSSFKVTTKAIINWSDATGGGTVSPAGPVMVDVDDSEDFAATASSADYKFMEWRIEVTSPLGGGTFTAQGAVDNTTDLTTTDPNIAFWPTASTTIQAVFLQKPVLTVSPNPYDVGAANDFDGNPSNDDLTLTYTLNDGDLQSIVIKDKNGNPIATLTDTDYTDDVFTGGGTHGTFGDGGTYIIGRDWLTANLDPDDGPYTITFVDSDNDFTVEVALDVEKNAATLPGFSIYEYTTSTHGGTAADADDLIPGDKLTANPVSAALDPEESVTYYWYIGPNTTYANKAAADAAVSAGTAALVSSDPDNDRDLLLTSDMLYDMVHDSKNYLFLVVVGADNYTGESVSKIGPAAAPEYEVTVKTATDDETKGTVQISGGTAAGASDTNAAVSQLTGATITAAPADGYRFVSWTFKDADATPDGSGYFGAYGTGSTTTSTNASVTFFPTAASTLIATFEPIPFDFEDAELRGIHYLTDKNSPVNEDVYDSALNATATTLVPWKFEVDLATATYVDTAVTGGFTFTKATADEIDALTSGTDGATLAVWPDWLTIDSDGVMEQTSELVTAKPSEVTEVVVYVTIESKAGEKATAAMTIPILPGVLIPASFTALGPAENYDYTAPAVANETIDPTKFLTTKDIKTENEFAQNTQLYDFITFADGDGTWSVLQPTNKLFGTAGTPQSVTFLYTLDDDDDTQDFYPAPVTVSITPETVERKLGAYDGYTDDVSNATADPATKNHTLTAKNTYLDDHHTAFDAPGLAVTFRNTGNMPLYAVKVTSVTLDVPGSTGLTGAAIDPYMTINYGTSGLEVANGIAKLDPLTDAGDIFITLGSDVKLAGEYKLTITVTGRESAGTGGAGGGPTFTSTYTLTYTVEPKEISGLHVTLPQPANGKDPFIVTDGVPTWNGTANQWEVTIGADATLQTLVLEGDGLGVAGSDATDVRNATTGADKNTKVPYKVSVEWTESLNPHTDPFELGKSYTAVVTVTADDNYYFKTTNLSQNTTYSMNTYGDGEFNASAKPPVNSTAIANTGSAVQSMTNSTDEVKMTQVYGDPPVNVIQLTINAPQNGDAPDGANYKPVIPVNPVDYTALYQFDGTSSATATYYTDYKWYVWQNGAWQELASSSPPNFDATSTYRLEATVEEGAGVAFADFADITFYWNNDEIPDTGKHTSAPATVPGTGTWVVKGTGTYTMNIVFEMTSWRIQVRDNRDNSSGNVITEAWADKDERALEYEYLDTLTSKNYIVAFRNGGNQPLQAAQMEISMTYDDGGVSGAQPMTETELFSLFDVTLAWTTPVVAGTPVTQAVTTDLSNLHTQNNAGTLTFTPKAALKEVGKYVITVKWTANQVPSGSPAEAAEYELTLDITRRAIDTIAFTDFPEPAVGDPILETATPQTPKSDDNGATWYIELEDGTKVTITDNLRAISSLGLDATTGLNAGEDKEGNVPYTVTVVWEERTGPNPTDWTATGDTTFEQGKIYRPVITVLTDENYIIEPATNKNVDYTVNGASESVPGANHTMTVTIGQATVTDDELVITYAYPQLPLTEIVMDVVDSTEGASPGEFTPVSPAVGDNISEFIPQVPKEYEDLYEIDTSKYTGGYQWYILDNGTWSSTPGSGFVAGAEYQLRVALKPKDTNTFDLLANSEYFWNDGEMQEVDIENTPVATTTDDHAIDWTNDASITLAYYIWIEDYKLGIGDKLNGSTTGGEKGTEPEATTDSRAETVTYLDDLSTTTFPVYVSNIGNMPLYGAKIADEADVTLNYTSVESGASETPLTFADYFAFDGATAALLPSGAGQDLAVGTTEYNLHFKPSPQGANFFAAGTYEVEIEVTAYKDNDWESQPNPETVTATYTLTFIVARRKITLMDVDLPAVNGEVAFTVTGGTPKATGTNGQLTVAGDNSTTMTFVDSTADSGGAGYVLRNADGEDANSVVPYTATVSWTNLDTDGKFVQGVAHIPTVTFTADPNYEFDTVATSGSGDNFTLNGNYNTQNSTTITIDATVTPTVDNDALKMTQTYAATPINEVELKVDPWLTLNLTTETAGTVIPAPAEPSLYVLTGNVYGTDFEWYVWDTNTNPGAPAWVAMQDTDTFDDSEMYKVWAKVEAAGATLFAPYANITFIFTADADEVTATHDAAHTTPTPIATVKETVNGSGAPFEMTRVMEFKTYRLGTQEYGAGSAWSVDTKQSESEEYYADLPSFPVEIQNIGNQNLTDVKLSADPLLKIDLDGNGLQSANFIDYFTVTYNTPGLDPSGAGMPLEAQMATQPNPYLTITPRSNVAFHAGEYEVTFTVEGSDGASADYTLTLTITPFEVNNLRFNIPAPAEGETPFTVTDAVPTRVGSTTELRVTSGGRTVTIKDNVTTRNNNAAADGNTIVPYKVTITWQESSNGGSSWTDMTDLTFRQGLLYRPVITLAVANTTYNDYVFPSTFGGVVGQLNMSNPEIDLGSVTADGKQLTGGTWDASGGDITANFPAVSIVNVYMEVDALQLGGVPDTTPTPILADQLYYEAVNVNDSNTSLSELNPGVADLGVEVLWQKWDTAGSAWVDMDPNDPTTFKFEYAKYRVIMTVDELPTFAGTIDYNTTKFHINGMELQKTTGSNPNEVVDNTGTFTMYREFTLSPLPPPAPPSSKFVVTYVVPEFGTTGDPTTEEVEKGKSPVAVPEVNPQKGYVFLGWSLSPDDPTDENDPELLDPTTVIIEAATTFYAIYKFSEAEHEHYIKGYPEGIFGPELNIRRSEVAAIIARAILGGFSESADYGNGGYTDVPDHHWARSAIAYCTMNGVFEGVGNNEFQPDRSITREEFALVFARLVGLLEAQEIPFTDAENVSYWAADGVYTAFEKGWIQGYPDGTFLPRESIRRDEAVKIVNRYLNRGVDHDGVEPVFAELKLWPDVPDTHWAYYEILEASNDHTMYYVNGLTPPEYWFKAYIETPSWQ